MPGRGKAGRLVLVRRVRGYLCRSGLGAAVLFGAAPSCGPSVQNIYEGNLRFEHCYRLDLDKEAAKGHRERCWQRWIAVYSFGQTRDRIEYARRRVRSIENGDVDRPTLNVDAPEPRARQFYLSVPAPTSAHSPPPPIATHYYGPDRPPPEGVPGDNCFAGCRAVRGQCLTSCKGAPAGSGSGGGSNGGGPAGQTRAGKANDSDKPGSQGGAGGGSGSGAACACDEDYSHCVRRCFGGD